MAGKHGLMIALLGASKKAKPGDDGDDKAPDSSDDVTNDDDDKSDYSAETDAGADALDAIKADDAEAFAKAICHLFDIHTGKE